MKLLPKSIFAALTLLIAGTLSSAASADVFADIDRTAVDIEHKTAELLREVKHYRHTPQYRHLCADARRLKQLATHVHTHVHNVSSLQCLKNDVRKMDAEFHHLQDLFRIVERNAAHGHGHVHGDTRHVAGLIAALENCIHSLEADVVAVQRLQARQAIQNARRAHQNDHYDVRRSSYRTYGSHGYRNSTTPAFGHGYPAPVYRAPVYTAPTRRSCDSGYNSRHSVRPQSGISIGRGNLNFRINF